MKWWERWSLHRRVLTLSAAAVTLAIVMGIGAYAVALDRILYSGAQVAARLQAGDISAAITTGEQPATLAVQDAPSQGRILQLIDMHHQVVATSDPAGQAVALTSLSPAPGHVATEQVASVPGEVGEPYAIAAQGVRTKRGIAYVVVVAAPLAVESNSVRTATLLLGVGGLGLLGMLVLLMGRMLDRALEPVERIRREVDRITEVRGRGQITVPGSGDEISRLARTMNQMLARLDQADSSTRRFVSDASHELRSPLATIRAAIEVSSTGHHGPDPERDALIQSEVLRMQRLVDDLLTLARADDGVPLASEEVDVDDIVDAEVRRLRATGDAPVRASIEAARVVGDRARLEQVVRNLVDNAARHTSGGITLSVGTEGQWVVLQVDNVGDPIPVEDREAVFERFTRLEESRQRHTGGSGLGLAIARTLVMAHGGYVIATETPAGQCRFEVRLPAADATELGQPRWPAAGVARLPDRATSVAPPTPASAGSPSP
jgi:signal transduction histidine kinase